MKCKEVEQLLAEDLKSDSSNEVERHLSSCEQCRQLYQDLAALDQLSTELKEESRVELPPFFTSRVCARIHKRNVRVVRWRVAAVTSGLAVLLSVAFLNFGDLLSPADRKSQVLRADARGQEDQAVLMRSDLQPPIERLEGLGWDGSVAVVINSTSSQGYILELPPAIEVRQTQAENEFYLKNVSH